MLPDPIFICPGGVGGLLQITDHASGKSFLPTYDGNGNIAALLNGSTGTVGALYEYSPYGKPLRAQVNDSVLADQPFRFSTKFTDIETSFVYYGMRYYSPALGRFLGRDTIAETGGLTLYGFAYNNPINAHDVHGMYGQVVAGAVIGGVVGGVADAWQNGWTLGNFFRGAVSGAVTGAITSSGVGLVTRLATSTATRISGSAAAGGLGAATGEMLNRGMGGPENSLTVVVLAGATGGVVELGAQQAISAIAQRAEQTAAAIQNYDATVVADVIGSGIPTEAASGAAARQAIQTLPDLQPRLDAVEYAANAAINAAQSVANVMLSPDTQSSSIIPVNSVPIMMAPFEVTASPLPSISSIAPVNDVPIVMEPFHVTETVPEGTLSSALDGGSVGSFSPMGTSYSSPLQMAGATVITDPEAMAGVLASLPDPGTVFAQEQQAQFLAENEL